MLSVLPLFTNVCSKYFRRLLLTDHPCVNVFSALVLSILFKNYLFLYLVFMFVRWLTFTHLKTVT